MKIAACISVLILSSPATFAGSNKKTPPPLQSKEVIEFLSKKDQAFLDFGKHEDFVGVITREGEASADLKTVDLYSFSKVEALAMDLKLCESLLSRLFGPLKQSSLKYHGAEIFTSHTGKTCEAQFDDPDKAAKFPERRVVLGFVNAKPVGIVFRLSKKSNDFVKSNIRDFWKSLR